MEKLMSKNSHISSSSISGQISIWALKQKWYNNLFTICMYRSRMLYAVEVDVLFEWRRPVPSTRLIHSLSAPHWQPNTVGSHGYEQLHTQSDTATTITLRLTFVVQCIHDQGELLEEVYIVFWTIQDLLSWEMIVNIHASYLRIESWCACMVALGLNNSAVSLATSTLGRPTCFFWNKNCLFKLLTSMVSKSIWEKYQKL